MNFINDTLPTMTFCKNMGQRHYGKYSADLFNNYSVEDAIEEVHEIEIYTNDIVILKLGKVVQKLSLLHYCFTLNGKQFLF